MRIYKSDAGSKSRGIKFGIGVQDSDLEEPTEEGRPEEMSDVDDDILKGYTSEESDLTRALRGVGMEEDLSLRISKILLTFLQKNLQ